MRPTEAVQYLPQRGLNPLMEVACAATHCTNHFTLAKGAAFPARNGEEIFMAFFCSELCYLEAIPPTRCARA
jgi:hypothetical protein